MAKKKKISITYTLWNTVGDYPGVVFFNGAGSENTCPKCSSLFSVHGFLSNSKLVNFQNADLVICPGNYIVVDSWACFDICTSTELDTKYENG